MNPCEKLPPFLNSVERIANALLGEKIPFDITFEGKTIIRHSRKITKTQCRELARHIHEFECPPSPIRNYLLELGARYRADIDAYCLEHFSES